MDYRKIEKYISKARLEQYEEICANDKQKVLKIYQANLRVSQAFYPLLSLLEVVLRNAINEELIQYFNDQNWLKNQRSGFMSDPRLTYYHRILKKEVTNDHLKKSVNKLIKRNAKGISQGKIISDLNFGFWTELFDKTYYQILQGSPIRIFSNLPTGANRKLVNEKLGRIRKFRNRISHHEAIIFNKDERGLTTLSLNNAEIIYKDIIDVFDWLDLDFKHWTRKINSVEFEIVRLKYAFESYPTLRYYIKRVHIGLKHYYIKYLK